MTVVEFGLLGPVEVRAEGRRIDAGPPQQRAVLVALLVESSRPVTPHTLIERVWDQTPPHGARRALHAHITRIRRMLESARVGDDQPWVALTWHSGGYVLDVPSDQVDLHQFIRLATAGDDPRRSDADRSESLGQAMRLWRGPALADLTGDWVTRTREAWLQRRLDVTATWAQVEVRLGRHREVLNPLRSLLAEHPLYEPLAGEFMRALVAAGRDAEALHFYATTRARLIDELGAEPSPELRATHEAILRGEVPRPVVDLTKPDPAEQPSTRVPAQLPADVPAFTGRTGELAELDAFTRSGDPAGRTGNAVVISAIAGTAGVGKTNPRIVTHSQATVGNQRVRKPGWDALTCGNRGYGSTCRGLLRPSGWWRDR